MILFRRQNVFLFIFSVSLLFSCTKILDDELPQKEPKLVINGIINPDSVFKINISQSYHVFENEGSNNLPFIQGASAKLYKGSQFLFDLEEEENGYYASTGFFPALNQSNKVEGAKSGFPSVQATTSIPDPVPILSFDTSMVWDGDEYYTFLSFSGVLKYKDPPGEENFYRLDCFQTFFDETGQPITYRQFIDVEDSDDYFYDKSEEYLVWNDLLTNGDEVTINFNIFFDHYYIDYGQGITDTSTVIYSISFSSLNEDFYKYDKSRSQYFESGGTDNPFSEPVLIYSNIENGYGVFGGFSGDTVSFEYSYEVGY